MFSTHLAVEVAAKSKLFTEVCLFSQMIVNKKCQKFDYGPTGNKGHYNQVFTK